MYQRPSLYISFKRQLPLISLCVSVPAAALATSQCVLIRSDVDRAERIAKMTENSFKMSVGTRAAQRSIEGSASKATDATQKAAIAAERSAAASERAAAAGERSARAVERSVQLQAEMLALQKELYRNQHR